MSISSTTNRNDYTGNGATDTYSYSFKIFAKTDLVVTVRDTDDVETTLTVDTHYTVSGVGSVSGGSVALVNGAFSWLDGDGDLKSNYALTIRRVRPLKQETDIRNQGEFFPETHEDAFDHFVMIDQQQQDEINRSVKNPETVSTSTFNPTLPADIATANKVLIVNSDGDGFDMGPSAGDITNAQTYASNAATSATASATSATASATSATASATSATASATSATASATSATSAATSASSVIWNEVVFITFANSPYTVSSSQRGKLIAVDCTSGAVSITLPQISDLVLTSPWTIGVKKTDAGSNTITINRAGSDTIDGSTTKVIDTTYAGVTLVPSTTPSPDKWTSIDFGTSLTDGSVTVAKLATDAVETIKIKDANVTAAKLATDAVETAKIKDANVTLAKIASGVIPSTLPDIDYFVIDLPVANPDFSGGALTSWTTAGSPTGAATFNFGLGSCKIDASGDSISQTLSASASGTISGGSGRAVKLVLSFWGHCPSGSSGGLSITLSYGASSVSSVRSFFSGESIFYSEELGITSLSLANTVITFAHSTGSNMYISGVRLFLISNVGN